METIFSNQFLESRYFVFKFFFIMQKQVYVLYFCSDKVSMILILNCISEHVAHLWRYLKNHICDCLTKSFNKSNYSFHVPTYFWATIWYKYNDVSCHFFIVLIKRYHRFYVDIYHLFLWRQWIGILLVDIFV